MKKEYEMLQIQNLSKHYEVKRITIEDIPTVYELCKGNPYYYEHMKMQPTIENLTESMTELPPGKSLDDKYFVGFWEDDSLIAILDLIIGYPNEDTAFVGWFMMNRERQGEGVGSEIVQEILTCMKNMNLQKTRLAYIKGNRQAKHFWLKNGFKPTGEESDTEDYTIVVMERQLKG